MDPKGIDELLNGTPDDFEAAAPEPVAEAPVEQPRDEQGRFAPKGETEPAPEPVEGASPAPVEAATPPLEHPALLGERRRRQEAERRAQELEQALARYQAPQPQAQPQQPQGIPDMFEDPEGYTAWLVQQATERAASTAEQRFRAQLIDASEQIARSKYADYDEKLGKFMELTQANPLIAQQMASAPDPAGFAYDYARKAIEVERYGTVDVEALKAKLREEIMAEETAKLPRPPVPTTLATERNVGARTVPWGGPRSIADILAS